MQENAVETAPPAEAAAEAAAAGAASGAALLDKVAGFFTAELLFRILLTAAAITLGLIVARLLKRWLVRLLGPRLKPQHTLIIGRAAQYLLSGLVVVVALNAAGVNLSPLLAAAGILTVAIGFAAQTSASNVISGVFMLVEGPFAIGDVIRVGSTTGEVTAIDLLSVKLRTFDNLFVRLPNETMLKSEITNLTRYPIRRIDVQLGVGYGEDIERVRKVLFEIADHDPQALDEPRPVFQFLGFGDSALNLQFSVWTLRQNFLELKTRLHWEIKRSFDREGIEIPFPQRTLHAGGEALPVRMIEGGAEHEPPTGGAAG